MTSMILPVSLWKVLEYLIHVLNILSKMSYWSKFEFKILKDIFLVQKKKFCHVKTF